jgi:hypothetical protein
MCQVRSPICIGSSRIVSRSDKSSARPAFPTPLPRSQLSQITQEVGWHCRMKAIDALFYGMANLDTSLLYVSRGRLKRQLRSQIRISVNPK